MVVVINAATTGGCEVLCGSSLVAAHSHGDLVGRAGWRCTARALSHVREYDFLLLGVNDDQFEALSPARARQSSMVTGSGVSVAVGIYHQC